MIMNFITFTLLTEVKILTDTTFVANTNDWESVTAITSHSIMNGLLLLHWFFSLKLRLFLDNNGLTNFLDYFRNHILDSFFNEFHALLLEVFLLLLPSLVTFLFSLFEIYHHWVPIRINCNHESTLVIFK